MAEALQNETDNMQEIEIDVSEPRGKDLIDQEISKLKGETGKVEVEATEAKEEPEVEVSQESSEESSEDKKDKYQNYSKDVQKRINTLVRRAKEAEEREAALANRLKQVEQQTSQTQSQYNTMQDGYYNEFKTRVETQYALAKDSLKKAYENNDPDQIIAAQELLSRATLDKERLSLATADHERRAQSREQEISNPQPQRQVQQEQNPAPDPRAKSWAENNPWFGSDEAMTYTAFSIHKKLIEEEGFDPNSDEYYTEIDRRIKTEFPHKFNQGGTVEENTSSKPRVVQPVASVKRGTGNARKVVRLTPRQIQTAKNLGVPLNEYAKHVKE
jgi:GH15 family glucan-1,4-alpha-glucosidase